MQVDHEIELPPPHIADNLKYSQDRKRLETIAQAYPIDDYAGVGIARHLDHFRRSFARSNRDARMREPFANRAQRRQAHYRVAELAKVDDQDVARVKGHFKCLSKKSAAA